MCEEAGAFLIQTILCRNNVHCSQAIGDVNVKPVFADLDLVKARMMTVCRSFDASVQRGFDFR
jgi:hypothetical protein